MPAELPAPGSLEPDRDALDLAERMLGNDETQQVILEETLEAADGGQIKEAGRTACGDGNRILGPLKRYPTSVQLSSCPRERGGAWHTHVTPDEVRSPHNSIPDVANVVYGYLDVIIVSGYETAEAFVRSQDPDAMKDAFQNILGIEASGPSEVSDAVMDGRISNPVRVRQRLRDEMPGLFVSAPTGYPEMKQWASEVVASTPHLSSPADYEMVDVEAYSTYTADSTPCSAYATEQMSAVGNNVSSIIGDYDIHAVAVSSAVGTLVGTGISKVVFGE